MNNVMSEAEKKRTAKTNVANNKLFSVFTKLFYFSIKLNIDHNWDRSAAAIKRPSFLSSERRQSLNVRVAVYFPFFLLLRCQAMQLTMAYKNASIK